MDEQKPERVQNKNLKPMLPGETRNPNGRPKGSLNSKTMISKWLKQRETAMNPIKKKMEKMSQLDIMILKQVELARKGNTRAFEALLDRVEGKPRQEQEITFGENSNIEFVVEVEQPPNYFGTKIQDPAPAESEDGEDEDNE